MKKQIILFVSLLLLLVSCGQTNSLSEEDYLWMPYHGDETLVFKSNKADTDTIFLLKKDTLWGYPDPTLSTSKYQIVAIFCKHSDSYLAGKEEHDYSRNWFLKIKKTMSKKAEIEIDLYAKDANFYRLSSIRIDSLSKMQPEILQTSYGQYNDVYVIEGEDYLGGLSQRSSFITKLYWSKSKGLVRYDKKDGIFWELSK